jgi:hypothetical protein
LVHASTAQRVAAVRAQELRDVEADLGHHFFRPAICP